METNVELIETKSEKESRAKNIVSTFVLANTATGLIPIVLVDLIAIKWIIFAMLYYVSKEYDVKFSKGLVTPLITAFATGIGSVIIGKGLIRSISKHIPIIGPIIGAAGMPVMAGAFTYAVGMVFIRHFNTGGDFSDFKLEAFKDCFNQYYREHLDKTLKSQTPPVTPTV